MNSISIVFGECLFKDISYYADFRAEVFELLYRHLERTTCNSNGYYDHTEYREAERQYYLRHDSYSVAFKNAPVFVKYVNNGKGTPVVIKVKYDEFDHRELDEPAAIIPVNQLHIFLNKRTPINIPTGERPAVL